MLERDPVAIRVVSPAPKLGLWDADVQLLTRQVLDMLRIRNGPRRIYKYVRSREYRSEMRRLRVAERQEAIRASIWKRWTAAAAVAVGALGLGGLWSEVIEKLL